MHFTGLTGSPLCSQMSSNPRSLSLTGSCRNSPSLSLLCKYFGLRVTGGPSSYCCQIQGIYLMYEARPIYLPKRIFWCGQKTSSGQQMSHIGDPMGSDLSSFSGLLPINWHLRTTSTDKSCLLQEAAESPPQKIF